MHKRPSTFQIPEFSLRNDLHRSFISDRPDYDRHALVFGSQKINLHQAGREFEPKAQNVQAGSGDLCFRTDAPVDEVLKTFQEQKVDVRQSLVLRYDIKSYLNERARD